MCKSTVSTWVELIMYFDLRKVITKPKDQSGVSFGIPGNEYHFGTRVYRIYRVILVG